MVYLYLYVVNGRIWDIFIGHNRGETGIEAAFSIEKEAELGNAGKRALKENSYRGYSSSPSAPDDHPTHSQAQAA